MLIYFDVSMLFIQIFTPSFKSHSQLYFGVTLKSEKAFGKSSPPLRAIFLHSLCFMFWKSSTKPGHLHISIGNQSRRGWQKVANSPTPSTTLIITN